MLRASAYASLSLMPPANLMLVLAYRLSSVFCPSCEKTATPKDHLDHQAKLLLSARRVISHLEGLRATPLAPSPSPKSP